MSYATKRDALIRTRQDLITVGVRECQNQYASLVQQLMTYTEEIDNAAWTKTSVTVTPNNATAPDGTLTADTCVFNADNDAIHQEAAVVVTSKAFTQSIWLRVPSGTATISLRIRNTSNSEGTQQSVTVTTTWTRFWLHRLFTGTPVDNVHSRLVRLTGDTINGDIEVWGWNLHRNPGDKDFQIKFPYVKRVAEAVGTVSVNASRCEAADRGDGLRCFYSRPTCQDIDNFNAGHLYENEAQLQGIREFKFCRQNAPLPLPSEDVQPMLVDMSTAAQEIDAERATTINERMTLEFEDDQGPGVWNLRQRAEGANVNTQSGNGTFWRRWVAIYKNYGNPDCYVRRRTGYVETGLTESGMPLRGRYLIQNFETINRRIKLTCGDRLKLTRKSIPAKISEENLLRAKMSSSDTTVFVEDASEFSSVAWNATAAAPDYTVTIQIENEKMNVTAIDLDLNSLTVVRARWGTTAAGHAKNSTITEIAEFGTERTTPTDIPIGRNPVNILIDLYRYAGLSTADIDVTTLESERDEWYLYDYDLTEGTYTGTLLRRTLTDVTDVQTLVQEICDLTLFFVWISEDQQLTGRAYAPSRPGASPSTISDDANLVASTIEVDDNDETRISRVLLAYDLPADTTPQVAEDFNKVRIEIDIDSEEREFYGDKRLKVLMSQWLQNIDGASQTVVERRLNDRKLAEYFTRHILARFRNGSRLLRAQVELKDDDTELGDYIRVDTAHIQDVHGNNLNSLMIVVKKKPIEDNRLALECLDTGLFNRYAFYSADGRPDYTSASDADKEYGYYADDDGFVGSPKEPGYYYW